MKSTTHGSHPETRAARTRAAFLACFGSAALLQRVYDISQLPQVEHKGRQLRTIRCQGDTGNGPHDQNVEDALLWSLIDLPSYRCPYHRR